MCLASILFGQTQGVSATFIRELMRKAALFAADESHESVDIVVEDRHVEEALKELMFEGGELNGACGKCVGENQSR